MCLIVIILQITPKSGKAKKNRQMITQCLDLWDFGQHDTLLSDAVIESSL